MQYIEASIKYAIRYHGQYLKYSYLRLQRNVYDKA